MNDPSFSLKESKACPPRPDNAITLATQSIYPRGRLSAYSTWHSLSGACWRGVKPEKCVSNTRDILRSKFISLRLWSDGIVNTHSFLELLDREAGTIWKLRVATLLLELMGFVVSEWIVTLAPFSMERTVFTRSRTSALLRYSYGIPRNLKLQWRSIGLVFLCA